MDGTNAAYRQESRVIADRNNITRVWMMWGMASYNRHLYIQQSGDIEFLLKSSDKDMQGVQGADSLWEEEQGKLCLTKV